MPASPCCQPDEPPQSRNPHRAHHLLVMLVLSGGFSLILYTHGASWWYAPLAIVLAHLVILGSIVFFVAQITQTQHTSDGSSCCRKGAGHTHKFASQLIHRPRLYDWVVRVITLGREKKFRQRVLDLGDVKQNNKVLDVGCGTGTLLLAAAERVGPSGSLHGIEPAAEMVAHAHRKAEARGIPLKIIEGSAASLPYPPASFDAVFCTLVLHHLPKAMQIDTVREIRRVLRPDGRTVIVDLQQPRSLAKAFTTALSLVSILHNLSPNTSRFNILDFEPLMTEFGFEDITQHAFGSGAIGALVGRLGCEKRAIDQTEPEDITCVSSDT